MDSKTQSDEFIKNHLLHFVIDEYIWDDKGSNREEIINSYKQILESDIFTDYNSKLNLFDDLQDYKRFITSQPQFKQNYNYTSDDKTLSINTRIDINNTTFSNKIKMYEDTILKTEGYYFIHFGLSKHAMAFVINTINPNNLYDIYFLNSGSGTEYHSSKITYTNLTDSISLCSSLEDLVKTFDKNVKECLVNYKDIDIGQLAPVQVRSQEDIMNDSQ